METRIWFVVQKEGQVQGPYTPEEVETQVAQNKDALIWGRGFTEWLDLASWRSTKDQTPSLTATAPAEQATSWSFRVDGGPGQGPFKYSELLEALKKLDDYSKVDVMGEAIDSWKEIYEVQKLVDELGISRRAHPRVPIMATLKYETPQGPQTLKVISISEGGLGANDAQHLKIGDKLKGTLTSPHLFVSINCTAEVVYVGQDSYAGLKFVSVPTESKSAIIEYVKKFNQTKA